MRLLVNWDPIAFRLGPLAVHWYGILMALSIAIGFYALRRRALAGGYSEDFIYNLSILTVLGGIVGARAVFVATNWPLYASDPVGMLRIDQGGLSFHGGLLGGVIAGGLYQRRHGGRFGELADWAVPGLIAGIVLVRIGNIFNQEVLGRPTELFFARHPAQLYGSAIGLILWAIHARLSRRRPPAGYLFWSFVLYYSILRGVIEETFRANPLYAWGYVNPTWGVGFFTLTHLITPPLVLLAWWLRRLAVARAEGAGDGARPRPRRAAVRPR